MVTSSGGGFSTRRQPAAEAFPLRAGRVALLSLRYMGSRFDITENMAEDISRTSEDFLVLFFVTPSVEVLDLLDTQSPVECQSCRGS